MRTLAITSSLAATLLCIGAAASLAQQKSATAAAPANGSKITVLADESVSDNDKLHALVATVEWQPGGASKRHFHAGDEYATVLEGAVEIDNDGEPPRIYKAGQAYHNRRGVVHIARNANNGPSKMSVVLIIDKGSEIQVPAP